MGLYRVSEWADRLDRDKVVHMSLIEHDKTSRLVVAILELVRIIAAAVAGFVGGNV